MQKADDGVRQLLVVKPSSLGDVVHGLVVVQALHRARPEVAVDWVVRSEWAPLVAHSGLVRRIYEFRRLAGMGAFLSLVREIRRTFYDAVWDLQGLARSAVLTGFARARRRIGRRDAREGAFLAYRERVGFFQKQAREEHAVELLAHFLPTLGVPASVTGDVDWPLSFRETEEKTPCIALCPEARGPGKEWPHFPELAQELLRSASFPSEWRIRVLGSRQDPDFAPHPRLEDRRGRTEVVELLSLLRSARCVVANDSGPVHIAASLRTPVLGLYGRTSPRRFGPYPLTRPSNAWLRAPGGDPKALPVADVLAILSDLLNRTASA